MLSLRQGLTELSTQPSFPSCCVIDVAVNTVPLLLAPTVATRYSELFVLPLAFHFSSLDLLPSWAATDVKYDSIHLVQTSSLGLRDGSPK